MIGHDDFDDDTKACKDVVHVYININILIYKRLSSWTA